MPCLIGPVASLIITSFDCRTCMVLSGVLAAVGTSSCFLITDFYLLYPALIVAGIGQGLSLVASFVAIGYNFPNQASVLTGMCVCGSGLGIFIHPPLLQKLVDIFGFHGAMLILGAVSLNTVACGLATPPSDYEKQRKLSRRHDSPTSSSSPRSSGGREVSRKHDTGSSGCGGGDVSRKHYSGSCGGGAGGDVSRKHDTGTSGCGGGDVSRKHYSGSCGGGAGGDVSRKHDTGSSGGGGGGDVPRKKKNKKQQQQKQKQKFRSSSFRSLCDVLSDLRFLPLLATAFGFSSALSCYYIYLPDFLLHNRYDHLTASFVLSATGMGSIPARLMTGVASNDPSIETTTFFFGIHALAAVVTLLVPFMAEWVVGQMVLAVLFGVYTGAVWACYSPFLLELLGIRRVADGVGLYLFTMGVGSLAGPPLAGSLYTASGDFHLVFYFTAAMFAAASGAAMLSTLVKPRELLPNKSKSKLHKWRPSLMDLDLEVAEPLRQQQAEEEEEEEEEEEGQEARDSLLVSTDDENGRHVHVVADIDRTDRTRNC
ncbi:uncharacterized protein LOC143286561 isoform X2 [Babylonia areolata]